MHVVARNDTSHLSILALQKRSQSTTCATGTLRWHAPTPAWSTAEPWCALRDASEVFNSALPPPPDLGSCGSSSCRPCIVGMETTLGSLHNKRIASTQCDSYSPFWGSCRYQCWMIGWPAKTPIPTAKHPSHQAGSKHQP